MTTDAPDRRSGLDVDGDAPLDPTASAALIEAQRARVISATGVDPRVMFGTWGVAWLLGFGVLWAVARDEPLLDLTPAAALILFMGLIWSAIIVTLVHVARRTAGVHGASAQQGAMYGWAWCLAFMGVGGLGYALSRLDVDGPIFATVMTVVSPIVVGALYMAGGAIWQDRSQFILGAWICIVTIAAAWVGYPHMLLVMAVAGGGGMLAAGAVEAIRRGILREIRR